MQTTNTANPSLPGQLQELRENFPLLQSTIYLANCSQGPLAVPVRTAVETFLNEWAHLGMHWNAWIAEAEEARAAFARLIGASPEEIALGTSASQLVSSVASALVASPHITRHRIVSSAIEFPGVAHAWLAMRKQGWRVDLLSSDEEGMVNADDFVTAVDEETTLISVPHVCYAHGALIELEPVVAAAHAQGSLVLVDAYQSIGTVPIDVKASGVDFLVAGTLKYLFGTAGIAFMYVKPSILEQLEPTVTGWFGRGNPLAFQLSPLDYPQKAARFDLGTPPLINAYTAHAGMELVLKAGTGNIRAQIERLSALAYGLASQLSLHVVGPKQGANKGATTAIDAGSIDRARWLEEELRQHGVIASARGSAIRLAPHGFTYEQELEQALHIIAKLLN